MNILKYLFPCIALLFIISTEVYADDSDKKKCHYNDGEKCHEKMWRKKGMWKQRPMHKISLPKNNQMMNNFFINAPRTIW